MQNPDRLPPRDLPRRRSGRHRDPLSFDSAVGTPTLVVAVPGSADPDGPGQSIANHVGMYRPEVTVRVGYTDGEEDHLSEVLSQVEPPKEGQPVGGVVVPLLTAPHPQILATITAAVERSGAHARVSDGLGPHPLLTELMHLRLAEGGFVRADRMRLISVVAAGTGMADGVVVGSVGAAEAVSAAGVTAVLLAARLGVTVLPAALDDPENLRDAFGQLRTAGSRNPVLAPCVLGTEPGADPDTLAALATEHGAQRSEPLGGHSTLAKIVAVRYAEILNAIGVEQQPTLENLPAPSGSRHRREK